MSRNIFTLSLIPALLVLVACDGSTPLDDVPAVADEPAVVTDPVVEDTPVANDQPVSAVLMARVSEDLTVALDTTTSLSAEVQLDGMAIDTAQVNWEQVSGSGMAVFGSPDQLQTSVSFDLEGSYVLRMTAEYQTLKSSDTLMVSVTLPDINEAPQVNAGANLTIVLGAGHQLKGTASDDGLPNAILSTSWSQTGGNGVATFGEQTQLHTSVTFSESGTYLLQLEASDGELVSSDRIQIVVQPDTHETDPVQASSQWQILTTVDGSKPQARHEAGGLAFNNKFYLLGGRGKRQVNRYDPETNKWENLGTPAMQMNHFQAVGWNGKIYVIGALDCCYPSESVVDRIQIFDPVTRKWSQGATMPNNRKRGSAGVVVYKNKIYIVGGSTNGHDGGEVNWFDEYDPVTDKWKTLPNAPTKRDHFQAAVVGDLLVAAGGRQTDHPNTFGNLVSSVDVFNFATGKWEQNIPNFPVPRAGTVAVSYGPEVIVIGGETAFAGAASKRVDAYNVHTRRWRQLDNLVESRHGGGAAILGHTLHVASGSKNRGGGPEIQSHEILGLR